MRSSSGTLRACAGVGLDAFTACLREQYSTSVRGGGDDTLDPIRWDQTGPSSEAYWFYFAVCNPWRVWSALKEVSEGCQGRPLFRGTVLKRLSRVRRALAREMERGEAWEQEAVRAEIRRVLEVAG